MTYDLMTGLAAMSAFGILIFSNLKLCEYLGDDSLYREADKGDRWSNIIFFYIPILGITYFSGMVGNIIINSEIISIPNLKDIIALPLILTITFPQIRFLYNIFNQVSKKPKEYKTIIRFYSGYWAVFSYLYMTTLYALFALFLVLFILFFFITLLEIYQKERKNVKRKKKRKTK